MAITINGTTGIAGVDGSAGTPAVQGTDTNTGIFFPAADTIAFGEGGAEVARFNSSGQFGIGTTPSYPLDVRSASTPTLRMSRVGTAGQNVYLLFEDGTATVGTGNTTRIASDSGAMSFSTGGTSGSDTGGTERARIDSSGNVLVGLTSVLRSGEKLEVGSTAGDNGGLFNFSATNGGIGGELSLGRSKSGTLGTNTIVASGDKLGSLIFRGASGSAYVQAASISADVDGTPGASNDMPGRLVFSTSADGSATPTERVRITSGGLVGVGCIPTGAVSVTGITLGDTGWGVFTRSSDVPLFVNRQTNDGSLVELRQDNTLEGTISVSGTTVSYNGGNLSRWAQMPGTKDDTLVKGTVMSNLDEMNVYTDAEGNPVDNEQLNKVKVSDVEGDVNVAGVFVNWTYDEAHQVDEINMAMTGDMIIRIAQGVVVQKGDLLMSAGDGTAKPQGDDIVRSKTVAKVTSNHVTCTYADGSYCVPCVLMAC